MLKKNRHSQIIEIMEKKNVISIKELAQKTGCTEMTIRRNLDELEKMHFVVRHRGYATLLDSARPTDYYEQKVERAGEKSAIAHAALSYIREGSSICIDSGTTTQQLVEQIPDTYDLSVITPSLTAAMVLSEKPNVQVMLPGGMLHHSNRSILIEESALTDNYSVDIAFLSCRSLRIPGGTFEHSQTLTNTKRALAKIARTRILLMDHSKWNVNSLCMTIPLGQIDLIITDTGAPMDQVQEAAALGKEIILVDPETREIAGHLNPPSA